MPLKLLDNISNGNLALCTPITYRHLAYLLNQSIKSNVFLIELECSESLFYFKSGERNDDANNYRHISVFSTIARILKSM